MASTVRLNEREALYILRRIHRIEVELTRSVNVYYHPDYDRLVRLLRESRAMVREYHQCRFPLSDFDDIAEVLRLAKQH